jgi:hypothetical protein
LKWEGANKVKAGGGELVPHITAHREGGASRVTESRSSRSRIVHVSHAIRYFHYSSTLRQKVTYI